MSWSFAIPAPADDFDTAAAKALTDYHEGLAAADVTLEDEAKQQIDTAVAAAKVLVESGAVGAHVGVSLSGHANPEHKPKQGWANDTIAVSVYQLTPADSATP